MLRGLVCVDRDGVIIENRPDYVLSTKDVEFIDGSIDGIRRLVRYGYAVAIVTNQACIGKGLISNSVAQEIQDYVICRLQDASSKRGILGYICPHLANSSCRCRKPLPGMLEDAAAAVDEECSELWMIGDHISDIRAGHAVGARTILVRTGRGSDGALIGGDSPSYIADNLGLAIDWLLEGGIP